MLGRYCKSVEGQELRTRSKFRISQSQQISYWPRCRFSSLVIGARPYTDCCADTRQAEWPRRWLAAPPFRKTGAAKGRQPFPSPRQILPHRRSSIARCRLSRPGRLRESHLAPTPCPTASSTGLFVYSPAFVFLLLRLFGLLNANRPATRRRSLLGQAGSLFFFFARKGRLVWESSDNFTAATFNIAVNKQ